MKLVTLLLPLFLLQNPNSHFKRSINYSTHQSQKEISWKGYLNGKIPVFLHYFIDGSLVVGEITYLNTKTKTPIPLLGEIESNGEYRLLEFEKDGTITGVILGKIGTSDFNGSWTSPKTGKQLAVKLNLKDTTVASVSIEESPENIHGSYSYQYGKDGYQGEFELIKIDQQKSSFELTSVTKPPALNVAQIDKDTVKIEKNQFRYPVPDSDGCEIMVKLYKGFAVVNYLSKSCRDAFGLGATAEGIYIKNN